MKAKIIYISSKKSFDKSDINAAFENLRKTLSLSEDVILFGVPLDDEISEIDNIEPIEISEIQPEIIETPEINAINEEPETFEEDFDIITDSQNEIQNIDAFDTEDDTDEIIENAPIEIINDFDEIEFSDEADTTIEEIEEEIIQPAPTSESTGSILSILTATKPEITEEEVVIEESVEYVEPFESVQINEDDADDMEIREDFSIEDLFDETPPLDFVEETADEEVTDVTDMDFDSFDNNDVLQQLASEYTEVEKTISTKPESNENFGKLKNFVGTFKRQRKKDTNALDGLFSWAGVAANDDDTPTPSYFSN